MSIIRNVFLGLNLALAMAFPTAFAADVDRSSAHATAQAFLTAYKAKDLAMMAELVNQSNKKFFNKLAKEGEASSGYKEVFSGWRWKVAVGATEVSDEIRYNKRGEALMMFSEMPSNEVAVFVLTNEAGVWGIEDINSPTPAEFAAMPTTPPK